jgi:uncharacterized membrane protein
MFMINFSNTISIERSLEDTFNFLSDFENIPKWNYYVRSVEKTSTGNSDQDTQYRQIRKDDEQVFRITHYEPKEKITVKTEPGSSIQFERTFVFESVNNTTRIEDIWKLDTGHNNIFEKLAIQKIIRAVGENLLKLKELLETGHTTLQDGRTVQEHHITQHK